uniref:Uncharacterized protein n=1 Tax=Cyclophora tenuis TaxID=216820 RepID=A0A7S1DA78_CYCTE|mmetsp:Transcript_5913/g.10365  ORF Transcript_5913/g.10365 Transcript_5913/m.10365 type:complete len:187 (+) Transcript_5913:45-605(+)
MARYEEPKYTWLPPSKYSSRPLKTFESMDAVNENGNAELDILRAPLSDDFHVSDDDVQMCSGPSALHSRQSVEIPLLSALSGDSAVKSRRSGSTCAASSFCVDEEANAGQINGRIEVSTFFAQSDATMEPTFSSIADGESSESGFLMSFDDPNHENGKRKTRHSMTFFEFGTASTRKRRKRMSAAF